MWFFDIYTKFLKFEFISPICNEPLETLGDFPSFEVFLKF